MPKPPPTHEEQINFLTKVQRIFAEGDFTATYKFALLISLTELAVEFGSDNGDELILDNRQIGLRFISLYWKQSLPYSSGREGCESRVLVQNNGEQASIISKIANFRNQSTSTTLSSALAYEDFDRLLSSVTSTVSTMPLTYLQNFGGTTDEFLYDRLGPRKIRLKPGITYCLRRFSPLIQQLARSDWASHIKSNRRNIEILGEAGDLEEFLFETSRQSLQAIGEELRKLDGPICFYCGKRLDTADVDHFVPFSLYSRDIAQNFILAHPTCNRSKSDTLAALPHLERWLERINNRSDDLSEIGSKAGFISDLGLIKKVGAWAYLNAMHANANAWLKPKHYTPIDSSYGNCFEQAAV